MNAQRFEASQKFMKEVANGESTYFTSKGIDSINEPFNRIEKSPLIVDISTTIKDGIEKITSFIIQKPGSAQRRTLIVGDNERPLGKILELVNKDVNSHSPAIDNCLHQKTPNGQGFCNPDRFKNCSQGKLAEKFYTETIPLDKLEESRIHIC